MLEEFNTMPIKMGTAPSKAEEKLTIVEQIYHQAPGEDPTSYSHSYWRVLPVTGEQVLQRRQEAIELWKKIDLVWFEKSPFSMFMIRSEEGKFPHTIPTEEMRATAESKILEVGFCKTGETEVQSTHLLVYPNEMARFSPEPGYEWYVRCKNGSARYTLFVFPG